MKISRNRYIAALAAAAMLIVSGCASAPSADPAAGLQQTIKDAQNKLESDAAPSADTPVEEPSAQETEETFDLFKDMSAWRFSFTSGAGGWETYMDVEPDGSFHGEYYDSDMGDIGDGYPNGVFYDCSFSGHFGQYEQKEPYVYSLKIEDIKYDKEPDTEEIIDGTLYRYTTVYGLADAGSEMVLHLAGAKTSDLSEEEMSWIEPTHFSAYFGEEGTQIPGFAKDVPPELPFPVLCNTKEGYTFFSENTSDTNKTYLVNSAKLPGLHSVRQELNDDGTYMYEDTDDSGIFVVRNTCVRMEKSYDLYNDADGFISDCLAKIYPDEDIADLYTNSKKDMYSLDYHLTSVNGISSDYAYFSLGSDESQKTCRGRFLLVTNYKDDECTYFAYAYIIENDDDYNETPYGSSLANDYTSSLTFTGRSDMLPSAGEGAPAVKSIFCDVLPGSRAGTLKAKKLVWITEEDKDLIEQYDIDTDDFANDYQVVAPDKEYSDYVIADPAGCPFYVQFPEDGFHKYLDEDGFNAYANRYEDSMGCMMDLYLNEKDEVVWASEIYTP